MGMANKSTAVTGSANVNPAQTQAAKTRKKRTPIDPNETSRQKFLRLGGVRVGKALQALKVIGNLSGSSYEYTPADIEKIRTALTNELTQAMGKFVPKAPGETKKSGPPVFNLA